MSFTPARAVQPTLDQPAEAPADEAAEVVADPRSTSGPTPEPTSFPASTPEPTSFANAPARPAAPGPRCGPAHENLAPTKITDILASGSDIRVSKDLGRYYDRKFQPLKKWMPLTDDQRARASDPSNRIISHCIRQDSSEVAQANAHLWVLGTGGVLKNDLSYAACYTHQEVRTHRLDLEPEGDIPPGAYYYVSDIAEGRLFELVMAGTQNDIDAQIDLAYNGIGGGAASSQHSKQYVERRLVLGLELADPRSVLSFSSTNATDLSRLFTPSSVEAPLRYTLTAIPIVYEADKARVEACQAQEQERLDAIQRKATTTAAYRVILWSIHMSEEPWDGMSDGSPPDPVITVSAAPRNPTNSPPPFGYKNSWDITVRRDLGRVEIGPGSPLLIRLDEDDSLLGRENAGTVTITDPDLGRADGHGHQCFFTEGSPNQSTACLSFQKL